jgi:tRNA-Thr(GGU) m(6)t(6)A37 methyltransferase TsaA
MKINTIESIGIIHTPHKSIENMPIQPKGAVGIEGYVDVDKQYAEGLKDLDGFSHIYLIYFFHKATRTELQVKPFMDTQTRGVFATRAPLRPNHIGLSIVRLKYIKNNRLMVSDIDILDNTPLIDIKPYVEHFDRVAGSQSGWLTASEQEIQDKRSDCRFLNK